MKYKINIHQIGARSGSIVLNLDKKFNNDITQVLYDADMRSHKQVESIFKKKNIDTHIIPSIIWNEEGKKLFNLTLDPFASSIFQIDDKFSNFYKRDKGNNFDYVYGDAGKVKEQIELEARTIDKIFEDIKYENLFPDFLSIDAESSEYEILEGAENLIKKNILAVYSEVSFQKIRKNQKLFEDVKNFLEKRGFIFVGFDKNLSKDSYHIFDFSPYRYPLGMRGHGFDLQSEAIFFRSIDDVVKISVTDEIKFINLCKLSFFAFYFGKIEFGLEGLKTIKNLGLKKFFENKNFIYIKFLEEVFLNLDNNINLPELFSDKLSYEESKNRFQINNSKNLKSKFFSLLKFLKLYNFLKKTKDLFIFLGFYLNLNFNLKINFSFSKFEKIFIKYKFYDQANLIRKLRKEQNG